MLKTLVTVGALVVAGLALAGTAAADCTYDQPGLMDYDYLQVCTLESGSYSSSYYSYTYNQPLNAYYYGYGSGEYNSAGAYLNQYSGEYCWSNPCETYSSTYLGSYVVHCENSCTAASVYANQYQSENLWGAYEGFQVGGYAEVEGEYLYVSYNQWGYNGGCTEQAYVGGSVTGFTEIVSPQDCLVPAEQLPQLPAL